MRRAFGHAAMMSDEGNAVSVFFERPDKGRLLKTPQLLGDEERRMRRAFGHAVMMSDEGNDVDGAFSAAC